LVSWLDEHSVSWLGSGYLGGWVVVTWLGGCLTGWVVGQLAGWVVVSWLDGWLAGWVGG